jgi:hypothetical protein
MGWGTAFIAVADDATAASHNPGGLVQLERTDISIVGSYFYRHDDQDVSRAGTVIEDQQFPESRKSPHSSDIPLVFS